MTGRQRVLLESAGFPMEFADVVEGMTVGLAERIFVGDCTCDPEWVSREVYDGRCPRHGLIAVLLGEGKR